MIIIRKPLPLLQGGAKPTGNPIYCGSNIKVPKGKIRGRPNQCFMAGKRAGFYAGVLKGQQQAPRPAPAPAPAPRPTPVPQLPVLQNLSLGVLRAMLTKHLNENPDLPKKYIVSAGIYTGQLKGLSYLGKNDYIVILRRYGLGI
jgi:hypothetical protein